MSDGTEKYTIWLSIVNSKMTECNNNTVPLDVINAENPTKQQGRSLGHQHARLRMERRKCERLKKAGLNTCKNHAVLLDPVGKWTGSFSVAAKNKPVN